MGKGFNNYMCKKFFHPSSADNLKRVWIATKKAEVDKKQQDELRIQYDREQELYNNKALLSKETKEKLELNFMYEPPPGLKKIGEKDDEEEEYKFEWQRTWGHAPKESYLKEGDEFNEQPFGIQVCQAKCIKCGKHGHMNTDRRCHLYGKAVDHEAPVQNLDQSKLLDEMKADGLAMRWSAWDMNKGAGPNHTMVEEERQRNGRETERNGERSKVRRDRSNSRNRNGSRERRDRSGSRNRRERSGSRDRRSYRDGQREKDKRRERSSERNADKERSRRDRSHEKEKSKRDRSSDREKSRRDISKSKERNRKDRSRSRDARRSRKEEGYSNPWV